MAIAPEAKIEAKSEPTEPTLPPPPPKPRENAASAKDKAAALKSISEFRRATAWQLHRWPLNKHVVEDRVKVHLPRSYLAKDGEDIKTIWAGEDLNQFVHKHYAEAVDIKELPATMANFVTDDRVRAHRHEYLGPDPRVVGYVTDVYGEIHIKWWDSFLQDQWMDKQKWKFQVELNAEGQWVEKDG
ncbi:hypothetical protein K474DRAFT_1071249 [Panus rudis PR-1116 ss-1]|nr:hypothetical protein K474DRAFT_1071249 [Panus rudis PR-1116 ss-1]